MCIIYGWGRRIYRNHGPVVARVCPNCGNEVYWEYRSFTTWFTLFFLPVIPYESKHFLCCPICDRGLELSGESLAAVRQILERARDTLPGAPALALGDPGAATTVPLETPASRSARRVQAWVDEFVGYHDAYFRGSIISVETGIQGSTAHVTVEVEGYGDPQVLQSIADEAADMFASTLPAHGLVLRVREGHLEAVAEWRPEGG